jgi:hypothetical protein
MELNVDQLFTRDSLLTLQGGAAAAWIVPTVIDYIFLGRVPKWVLGLLSLAIALGLSGYAATLSDEQGTWTWVVAVLNGFLIAFTALGLNKTTERVFGGKPTATPAPAPQPAPAASGSGFGADLDRAVGAPAPAEAPEQPKSRRAAGFTRGWL